MKCKHEQMWFSRTIEEDDRMHYFCEDCGKRDDEIDGLSQANRDSLVTKEVVPDGVATIEPLVLDKPDQESLERQNSGFP